MNNSHTTIFLFLLLLPLPPPPPAHLLPPPDVVHLVRHAGEEQLVTVVILGAQGVLLE